MNAAMTAATVSDIKQYICQENETIAHYHINSDIETDTMIVRVNNHIQHQNTTLSIASVIITYA
jgi:sulfur carrier protein ThiS